MLNKKKGQGLVTGIIAGVGVLVITTIVIFLVTSTINSAGLITASSATGTPQASITLTEAGTVLTTCNANAGGDTRSIATITVINATGGETINSGNYTTSICTLKADAANPYNNTLVNVSSYTISYNTGQQSSDQMITNFTSGVDNVSNKLPTILLVAAVVILFGAIVLLVQRSRSLTGNTSGL